MAKLPGILPLRGTIQEMTFAHTRNGVIVKKKTNLTKERMDSDPAFARTREAMADFRTATKSARLIYNALRGSLPAVKDSDAFTRTQSIMKEAMRADNTNPRGQKTVTDGNLAVVQGFDFNKSNPLENLCFIPYTTTVNRVAGELEVTLPVYIPTDTLIAPSNATHYRIVVTGAELNFSNLAKVVDKQMTSYLVLDSTPTALSTLTCAMPANSTHPMVISLGVEYFLEDDGTKYPLKDGSSHAIVKVDA